MEFFFLFGSTSDEVTNRIIDALNTAPRLSPIDGKLNFCRLEGIFAAAPIDWNRSGPSIVWDGHGFDGNHVWSSGMETGPNLHQSLKYLSTKDQKDGTCEFRGIFCLASIETSKGNCVLSRDPLSQFPVFTLQKGGMLLVSNNIYFLEATAKNLGMQLSRSILSGTFELAFGIGAHLCTGMSEIKLLDTGKRIIADSHGWQLSPIAQPALDHLPYHQLLELGAQRLTDYVGSLMTSIPINQLCFDLTGGKDSRLVLAAALANRPENLQVFAGGPFTSSDKQTAISLANQFGLTQTQLQKKEPDLSAEEQLKTAVFRQQGHNNLQRNTIGALRLKGQTRVGGAGGEFLHCFKDKPNPGTITLNSVIKHLWFGSGNKQAYSAAWLRTRLANSSSKEKAAIAWQHHLCAKPKSHLQLFQPSFLSEARKKISEVLEQSALGIESMDMDYYLADRCARHFGYSSMLANHLQGYFQPLFDPVLVAAARKLTTSQRQKGQLVFDLMHLLVGRSLFEVPFNPSSLSSVQLSYLRDKGLVSDKADKTLLVKKPKDDASMPMPKAGGSFSPNEYLSQNFSLLENLVGSLNREDPCWNYFNRSNLLASIKNRDYFFKNHARTTRGIRLLHSFAWVSEIETHRGVEELARNE